MLCDLYFRPFVIVFIVYAILRSCVFYQHSHTMLYLESFKSELDETLGLLALKYIEIKEGLKTKAYEISVLNQKHDELVKKSLLTRSQLEGYLKENTKVIENCKGKSVENQFDKPSVVRQPNLNHCLLTKSQHCLLTKSRHCLLTKSQPLPFDQISTLSFDQISTLPFAQTFLVEI
ncbi:hypothetical protein Tco_1085505 [Tanacetum coccineum]